MKKLIVFRSLPLHRDARTLRYKDTVGYSHIELNTWEDYDNVNDGIHRLKLDKKKYSKLLSYPLYLIYLFFYSLFYIKDEDVVCLELDTFLPVWLGSFFKKNKIYFDIVDPIAETKFKNLCCNRLFDYLEIVFLNLRCYNILPNENRVVYYVDKCKVKSDRFSYQVIENVPTLSDIEITTELCNHNNIKIGYLGTLEEERGILELIGFVKNHTDINLIIAGDGKLKEKILRAIESVSNIEYLGSFRYQEVGKLYAKFDFLWAYYSDKVYLHRYASPNKYYEHLAFKKPIITNEVVPFGKSIVNYKTGIIIKNNLDERTFKNMYDMMKIYRLDEADFSLWEKKYAQYKIILKS